MSVGFFGAFLGGILTLLSPCSVMLLPAFFAYAFSSPAQILARTGIFFLGLATTLVPLGMLAGSLGQLIQQYRSEVVLVASIIVIVLGFVMLLGIPIPGLANVQGASSTSIISVYALGTIYGVAGVCAGPLLGAVLTVAGATGNPLFGGLLLLFFAAGMAFPLLLLALLWQRIPAVQKLVRPREVKIGRFRNTWTAIIGGALTIIVGVVLLVTDGTASLGGILNASTQFKIESSVLSLSDNIPNWVFGVGALAVLIVVWLFLRSRKNL
ncbi:MAG TPA: cytochrome c biogenesis protein CcdA [Microbacteriaceae bacterium]|nr:cytochrome c biogenesis protein CcdA [Microbacteriaceae bacterium]